MREVQGIVTIAIEFGELPAPNGEPLMDASAPEVESITGVPDGLPVSVTDLEVGLPAPAQPANDASSTKETRTPNV